MPNIDWSAPVSWEETCARSSGRRKINAVRQLRAWVRQRAVLRRLRALGGLTRHGVQAQLARECHVSPSVISSDIRRLFEGKHTRPAQARQGLTPQRRVPQPPEAGMPHKISVRLHPALNEALQQAARDRGVSPSMLIRTALYQFLGPSPPMDDSLAPLPDAWEALLADCPSEVQVMVRQAVDRTGLPVADVLRSLVIAATSMPPQGSLRGDARGGPRRAP